MSSSNVRLGLTVITKTSTNLQTESCDLLIVQLHAPVTWFAFTAGARRTTFANEGAAQSAADSVLAADNRGG